MVLYPFPESRKGYLNVPYHGCRLAGTFPIHLMVLWIIAGLLLILTLCGLYVVTCLYEMSSNLANLTANQIGFRKVDQVIDLLSRK